MARDSKVTRQAPKGQLNQIQTQRKSKMNYFKIPIPSFEKENYEARIIKCYTNELLQWYYTRKGSYAENELVPDVPIYRVENLEELILLAYSEPIERNGLTILCVQKGTMKLINPVEIER
jgi:hypothetical protein